MRKISLNFHDTPIVVSNKDHTIISSYDAPNPGKICVLPAQSCMELVNKFPHHVIVYLATNRFFVPISHMGQYGNFLPIRGFTGWGLYKRIYFKVIKNYNFGC